MRQQSKEYIVIAFIVSVMALNYPFLDLFDTAWMPLGIPLLYFYLYLFWFAIIVLLIAVVEHSEVHETDQRPSPPSNVPARPRPAALERSAASDADPERGS
ncbi:MAG: hypothetical protein JNM60_05245 [Candidatus Competibacteraceae bacterium]|nr:hypothetical protein [Candidatus Competibacteraceae bacterium]